MALTRIIATVFVFTVFELLCANAGPIDGTAGRRAVVTTAVGVVPVEAVPMPSSTMTDAYQAAANLYNMLPSMPSLSSISLPDMPKISLPDMPSLPNISLPSMPDISLPSMPDISLPSMPSLPSLPNISLPSMPDITLPELPALPKLPDISLPDMSKLPKMPDLPDMATARAWASEKATAAYNALPSSPVVVNSPSDTTTTTTTVEVLAVQ